MAHFDGDLESAATLADELREAIAAETVGGGLRVTMSFGVGASRRGESFDYDAVFRRADRALYEAKSYSTDRACNNRPSAVVSS
ncbi:MAG TPA: diguanylate cyclase [Solirubrobacterales bacterium]|nr:diguanylate cyclase [Solirubrobacterales bacterium]